MRIINSSNKFLIISILFMFLSSVYCETSILMRPYVNEAMLSSDYWKNKLKNPNKVLMTKDEIKKWNKEITEITYENTVNPFKLVCDIKNYETSVPRERIINLFPKRDSKSNLYRKVGNTIHEFTDEDWASYNDMTRALDYVDSKYLMYIYDEEGKEIQNNAPESNNMVTLYKGITVNRVNMRLFPTDEFVSDDEAYWYDDLNQNSGAVTGTPLLVMWESRDGRWYFVKTPQCVGWVHKNEVALCKDEEEFDYYNDYYNTEDFITITDHKYTVRDEYIYYPEDCTYDSRKSVNLFMGTRLHTYTWSDDAFRTQTLNRVPHYSYAVEIPYRKNDGYIGVFYAALPSNSCVRGFMPFTQGNVLDLAFKTLGERYGWGGMADVRDCTEYTSSIYACFGLIFARNSRWQAFMPGKGIDFKSMDINGRYKAVNKLEVGSVLSMPGHVVLYLGKEGNQFYCINAQGICMEQGEEIDTNSVGISVLTEKRRNGLMWIEAFTDAKFIHY